MPANPQPTIEVMDDLASASKKMQDALAILERIKRLNDDSKIDFSTIISISKYSSLDAAEISAMLSDADNLQSSTSGRVISQLASLAE